MAKRTSWLRILVVLPLAAVALSACDGLAGEPVVVATVPARQVSNSTTYSQAQIANTLGTGETAQSFLQNCAPCHGQTGVGDGPVMATGQIASIPNFQDPSTMSVNTAEEAYEVITVGRLDKLMPNWDQSLSEQERRDLADLVMNLRNVQVAQAPAPESTEAALTSAEATAEPALVLTIQGSIDNGTGGAELDDPSASAMLHIINASFQELDSVLVNIVDGMYSFPDVEIKADQGYAVTVVYKDMTFASEVRPGEADAMSAPFFVTVYEPTSDESVLKLQSLTTYATFGDDDTTYFASVQELVNTSDRAYNGGVRFTLPEGAQWLDSASASGRYTIEGTTIIDNLPVVPQQTLRSRIHYQMSHGVDDLLTVSLPINYDMSADVQLRLPQNSFEVQSSQLASQGVISDANGQYAGYQGIAMKRGETLDFSLKTLPSAVTEASTSATTSATLSDNQAIAVLLAGGGVTLLLASLGLWWYERRHPLTQDALARRIAELDLAFQRGELEEALYQRQRQALKTQLSQVLKKSHS